MTRQDPDANEPLDIAMAEIARETGAIVRAYPRPGQAVRRVVLRDTRGDRGTQFETAQLEDDGTVRITGRDSGAGVTEFFGGDISSYEWVYVVAPERVYNLLGLLGGQEGGDVLVALAAYHQRHQGLISDVLGSPQVAAEFSNWHS
jgi:hypothetical protein